MPESSTTPKSRALFGLLRRRESWCLSARGWLALLVFAASCSAFALFGVHPFLAVTHRVQAEVLVTDCLSSDYALKASLEEFRTGHYRRLLTTGGLCKGEIDVDPDDTYARLAADALKRLGADTNLVSAVPAPPARRDRTFTSAVAVREWLAANYPQIKTINIVTIGSHARRTRLMYEKALGKRVAIGIIALDNPEYDPRRWWRYSEGVKEVISETSAYVYARVLFRPVGE